MQQVSGGGAFTRANIAAINSNFTSVGGIDLWVRPQAVGASNTNVGSYDKPFATMTGLAAAGAMVPGVTIGLQGVLKEIFVAPAVNDITIVGVANQPRQATSDGVPNGGGATWMNPGTVASALVTCGSLGTDNGQAWTFKNIFFGQAGSAACVIMNRTLAGADSSHSAFYNCTFTAPGVNSGIGLSCGEILRLIVDHCQFYDFNGTTARAIYANIAGGIANPPYLEWQITNNTFTNNVNHIVGALRNAVITGNNINLIGKTQTTTGMILLAGGANNIVMGNNIADASAGPSVGTYTGGTADAWFNNYNDGAVAGVPS